LKQFFSTVAGALLPEPNISTAHRWRYAQSQQAVSGIARRRSGFAEAGVMALESEGLFSAVRQWPVKFHACRHRLAIQPVPANP
jgi:hypothetical protein